MQMYRSGLTLVTALMLGSSAHAVTNIIVWYPWGPPDGQAVVDRANEFNAMQKDIHVNYGFHLWIVETAPDAGCCAGDDDHERVSCYALPRHGPVCWLLAILDQYIFVSKVVIFANGGVAAQLVREHLCSFRVETCESGECFLR